MGGNGIEKVGLEGVERVRGRLGWMRGFVGYVCLF